MKRRAFIALSCFLLLVVLFAQASVVHGKGTSGKKKTSSSPLDKKLKNKREELKKTKCNFLSDELMIPCQNYYISPSCFQKVYGEYGLEFGELPAYNKDNEYVECFKKQEQARQQAQQ